jgi:N-acetylmuramoyl-L-alanine amidase
MHLISLPIITELGYAESTQEQNNTVEQETTSEETTPTPETTDGDTQEEQDTNTEELNNSETATENENTDSKKVAGIAPLERKFYDVVVDVRFSDIGETHRAAKEIMYLSAGKIANGDPSGKFFPDRLVTRAEAAAMIGRTLGFDGTKKPTEFTDVGMNNFASGYIQLASDKKIITGYKDGSFKPDKFVTRGEMAILLSRAFEYGATSISGASHQLMYRGISQGMPDGTFGEKESIKRSDFSVFLSRAINPYFTSNYQSQALKEYIVNATDLNVRRGPLTTYGSIGRLQKDTTVYIHHEVGDWALIEAGSIEGFVNKNFLMDPNKKFVLEEYLKTQTIVIDAGHGGTDPGALGNGLLEKNITLDVALKVNDLFQNTGFNIKLTRETDVKVELPDRVKLAKEWNGNVFVSIHANAFDGKVNGTETYYYSANSTNPYVTESRKLAQFLQARLLQAWNLHDRGVKRGNFQVIRDNNMPAALVELGFIDNKTDAERLKSASWRQEAAKAIYLGILDYYKDQGIEIDSLYPQSK